ncbi:MAG: ABC transporter ATP-binding protein, partial [Candidatus Methanomethylophilaceae archaeon]|nr:ABC transporter ATP-binding protein [Candidatus Methanomethylophilaceae archaeon]
NIDLVIKDGEYVTILGPSGCGKTTLIKMISGILVPSEGRVLIDGKDVTGLPIEDRDNGYVFQNIALFPHLNLEKNVAYGQRVRDRPKDKQKEVSHRYLELVNMLDRMQMLPGELSGGEQQKVAIARALASGSRLLLLDEPLSALDARVRVDLRYDIRRLVKDLGITVIHVTHDQEEAMSVSDRIVLMRNGSIVESDAPMNLYRSPNNIFTAYFIGETNLLLGAVSRRDEKNVYVMLRDGSEVRVKETPFKRHDAVVLSVRPEYVYTANEGLKAEVEEIIFMGTYWRIRTTAESEDKVEYNVPIDNDLPCIGDVVYLVFNRKMTMAYERPRQGLEEAIKLE